MVKIGDRVIFHDGFAWRTGQVWSLAPIPDQYAGAHYWIVTDDQQAHHTSAGDIRHAVPIRGGDARQAALAA